MRCHGNNAALFGRTQKVLLMGLSHCEIDVGAHFCPLVVSAVRPVRFAVRPKLRPHLGGYYAI
jgi:hypothetical protein